MSSNEVECRRKAGDDLHLTDSSTHVDIGKAEALQGEEEASHATARGAETPSS